MKLNFVLTFHGLIFIMSNDRCLMPIMSRLFYVCFIPLDTLLSRGSVA